MRSRAFTLMEVILVLVILALIIAFAFPNYDVALVGNRLTESADRLRAQINMSRARAMQEGLKYRISFPGTPDPNDKQAEKEIDVPLETLQPEVFRQSEPLKNPEAYGRVEDKWATQKIMMDGVRCVAVLPGKPNFEITPESPIAGPSISEGRAEFVPLTLNPDGTTHWVTFVLTDLPFDTVPEDYQVGRILNVIVDGRTGQTWVQRALRVTEVELMNEHGASPILHQDFTRSDAITEENILEVQMTRTGETSIRRK